MKEYTPEKPIENLFGEINWKSTKWLLSCSYSAKTDLIADHLRCIVRGIDFYSSKYDNFVVLGDLNTEFSNSFIEQFCVSCNSKSLIKEPTCFKSIDYPSCIDLILTNHPKCFQNSGVYETGISDFHKLAFTVLFFRRPNWELSNAEIKNTLITMTLGMNWFGSYPLITYSLTI